MEKIKLKKEHIEVIKQYFRGEVSDVPTDFQLKYFPEVLDMAEKRLNCYPEDYDDGGDLVRWFWNEYLREQANE